MLIGEKLNGMMNAQIGNELGASNQYLMIAAYFDTQAMPAAAQFFQRQSEEERAHALKFFHFILEAGGKVEIPAVAAPAGGIENAVEAIQKALDWEMEVTEQITGIMEQAIADRNYIAQEFMRWFVNEQLEEVSTMDTLLTVAKRAGEQLHVLEHHIAQTGHPEDNPSGGE